MFQENKSLPVSKLLSKRSGKAFSEEGGGRKEAIFISWGSYLKVIVFPIIFFLQTLSDFGSQLGDIDISKICWHSGL